MISNCWVFFTLNFAPSFVMKTFTLVLLAIQALLLFVVQADRSTAVQRKLVPFSHATGKHKYIIANVVNAKTFYPGLKDHMDNWVQIIQHLNKGARAPPDSNFWDKFYLTQKYTNLAVSDKTHTLLHQNAYQYKLECHLELDISATPDVHLAIETMNLYSDPKVIFQMLAEYPKVTQIGGHCKLHKVSAKLLKCYSKGVKPPNEDQKLRLLRKFTPVSFDHGSKGLFEVENVIQPRDLTVNEIHASRGDLRTVAFTLNHQAGEKMSNTDWNNYLNDRYTPVAVTSATYNAITMDAWQYKCSIKVDIPLPDDRKSYTVETMQVIANDVVRLQILDQFPEIRVVNPDGKIDYKIAYITKCTRMSPTKIIPASEHANATSTLRLIE